MSASTSASFSIPHGIDRDALLRVVEPVVHAHGAELVDLELKPDRGGWVLRVCVEKAGAQANRLSTRDAAVDLELCADVSRDLSPALDVVDLIPHAYHLEVGSPGVERPLRGANDFARFTGQKAKLKLREPVGGQRVVIGVIAGVTEARVSVTEGSRTHEVPLALIERARLVFELSTQPKGGSRGKGAKGSGPAGKEHKQRKH
jgi:ribosome maturation factor RimP